jgi:hypothetical protein
MRRPAKRADWGGIAFLLALYLAPLAIGRLAFHSSWRALAIAYALCLGGLFLFSLWPGGGSRREKVGWAIGLGMFFTTPVVLTLLLLMKEVGGLG